VRILVECKDTLGSTKIKVTIKNDTMAMFGYALSEERRKDMLKKPRGNPNLINQLPMRKAKIFRSI
jgi:hypothetical protein